MNDAQLERFKEEGTLWDPHRETTYDLKERVVRERKVCSKCGSETGYDWPSELCNPCWQAEELAKVPEEAFIDNYPVYDWKSGRSYTREGFDQANKEGKND